MRKKLVSIAVLTMVQVLAMAWGIPARADHEPRYGKIKVIAKGLNNPRGILVDSKGHIFVTEAGKGGSDCHEQEFEGEVQVICFGKTGSVAEVDDGEIERIAWFPSQAEANGDFATGPHDLVRAGDGAWFVSVGDGVREVFNTPQSSNALYRLKKSGKSKFVTDLVAFEEKNDPDGNGPDSNPYGLLATDDGVVMADAGANDLLRISDEGKVRTIAVLPQGSAEAPPFLGLPPGTQIPTDAVPTTVVEGPDGSYLVGQLGGFPFEPGDGNIFKVRKGKTPKVLYGGFTQIIDIAWGPDGALYVLEFAKNGLFSDDPTGALIRLDKKGKRKEIASAGLVFPGGLAFGPDGSIYITNYSASAGGGQVVKIPRKD